MENTSSAIPKNLAAYASGTIQPLDQELINFAPRLQSSLERFRSRCIEINCNFGSVGDVADSMRQHGTRAMQVGKQVEDTGEQFAKADVLPLSTGGYHSVFKLDSDSSYADMARVVQQGSEEEVDPIRLIKIGENEFLLLVAGTNDELGDFKHYEGSHSWLNAPLSGMGLQTTYTAAIKDVIAAANLPDGATLHMAGHSQGAHNVNLLAVDEEITSRLNVATVLSYGAFQNLERNPNVQYHQYVIDGEPLEELGDVTNFLHNRQYGTGGIAPPLVAHTPEGDIYARTNAFRLDADGYEIPLVANVPTGRAQHSAYPNSSVLQNVRLPFDVNQWETIASRDVAGDLMPLHDSLNRIFNSGDPFDVATGLYDTPHNLMMYGGAMTMGLASQLGIPKHIDLPGLGRTSIPEPVRGNMRDALQAAGSQMAQAPSPSRAAGKMLARIRENPHKAGEFFETAQGVTEKVQTVKSADEVRKLLFGLSASSGGAYSGQVILKGGQAIKDLAGLPESLTHMKVSPGRLGAAQDVLRSTSNIGRQNLNLAKDAANPFSSKLGLLSAGFTVASDFSTNYEEHEGDVSKIAVGTVVDSTLSIGLQAAGTGAGAWAGGALLGAGLGAVSGGVLAPVGVAVGSKVGGVFGGWVGGKAADKLSETQFDEKVTDFADALISGDMEEAGDIVDEAIDSATEFATDTASKVESGLKDARDRLLDLW